MGGRSQAFVIPELRQRSRCELDRGGIGRVDVVRAVEGRERAPRRVVVPCVVVGGENLPGYDQQVKANISRVYDEMKSATK